MKGKPSLCRDILRARGDNGRETETENRIKENRGRGLGSYSPADAIIKKKHILTFFKENVSTVRLYKWCYHNAAVAMVF